MAKTRIHKKSLLSLHVQQWRRRQRAVKVRFFFMETNLEEYAKRMSKTINELGTDAYHWSEITTVIDELLKYVDSEKLKGEQ